MLIRYLSQNKKDYLILTNPSLTSAYILREVTWVVISSTRHLSKTDRLQLGHIPLRLLSSFEIVAPLRFHPHISFHVT